MYSCNEVDIQTKQDLLSMIKLFKEHKVTEAAFDTETTGLNIRLDKPFLFQFGWMHEGCIFSYVIDIEAHPKLGYETIWSAFNLISKGKAFIGHNVKFDLHQCRNLGIEYKTNNLVDTQVCIRLAHDALTPANGGPPLGLKEYASQYIDRSAKDHERLLKRERTDLAKTYNLKLITKLKQYPNPPKGYKP